MLPAKSTFRTLGAATVIIASVLAAAGVTTGSAISGIAGQNRPAMTVALSAPGIAASTDGPGDTPWG